MTTFWKVNVISVMYAVTIFIPIELFVNVSRISRLTGWELNVVGIMVGVCVIVSVLLLSVAIIYLTKMWLRNRKSTYWSVLLWLPYFILFILTFASLFPINNPADQGGPGDGIIILGLIIFYPLFILVLNTFSTFTSVAEHK
ncbi:hypothetical protein [Alkalibacillus aidingensis]|uniref:hypothetical protein n=1 Tax=Alkalibacillus aidingensis TaxID=2747607 RepID=UPI001660EEB6|nr:hypothetical protein [Alkalibacillus aidingensis]